MLVTAPYPNLVLPVDSRARSESTTTSARGIWIFSALTWGLYSLVGWWLVSVKEFMINDALAKTLTAQLMVLSRDPHLANMGYYWMPLPMFLRIPFVLLLYPWQLTIYAGPLTSGLMTALTLPVLHKIGQAVGAPRRITTIIVVVYALSPVTIWASATGMGETTYGLFLALTILGYVRWMRNGGTNNLVFMGLAFGFATLSRFESLLLLPVLGVVCAIASERGRRLPTAVIALLPSLIAFGLYTLASAIIMRDPIAWWTMAKIVTVSPAPGTAPWLPDQYDLPSMAAFGIGMIAVMAPGAYAVLGGGLADRNRRWASLGLLGLIVAQPMAVCFQLHQSQSWATPRLFGYVTPLGTACAALWLLRDRDTAQFGERIDGRANPFVLWRRRFGYLTVALLPFGALTSTFFLANPLKGGCEGEYVFMRPLLGRTGWTDPVEASPSLPVFVSRLSEHQHMIHDLDQELAKGKMVAMSSEQAFPLLFSKHAKNFIVPEDRDFEPILSDPIGKIDYIVILNGASRGAGQMLIENLVGYVSAEGSWTVFKKYEIGTIYQWTPTTQRGTPTPTAPPSTGAPVPGG